MLKVIKSNLMFALVLSLSIPAYAAQPESDKSVTTKKSWLVVTPTITTAMISKLWNTLRGTGLSWARTGISTATRSGKAALNYVAPIAKSSLKASVNLAKSHPTTSKLIAGTCLAAGLSYATYRAFKRLGNKLGNKVAATRTEVASAAPINVLAQTIATAVTTAPQASTAEITQNVPAAPVKEVSNTALTSLQAAKDVAEDDIAAFTALREAGKAYALAKDQRNAQDYFDKQLNFKYNMAKCDLPDNQKQLQKDFIAGCKQMHAFLNNEENCRDEHRAEFNAMIEQLHNIIEQLDEAIAIEMSL